MKTRKVKGEVIGVKVRMPNPFNKKAKKEHLQHPVANENDNNACPLVLSADLEENLVFMKETLGNSSDLVLREFSIGDQKEYRIAVAYTDGLVDKTFIQDFILEALMMESQKIDIKSALLEQPNLFQC